MKAAAVAILFLLVTGTVWPAAKHRSSRAASTHHRRPASRGEAVQSANGRKTKGKAVKRVTERRMVRGHWVKVSRMVAVHSAPAVPPHPEPERYRQIQTALAEQGYFKGEANGQWNADSVEALKRFQENRKLPGDGKINARSLIGLGLGPKHDGTIAPTTSPTASLPPNTAQ